MPIPRPEYPRPQFARPEWINLNGPWQFQADNGRNGEDEGLFRPGVPLSGTITVPFCPESRLSGVHCTQFLYGAWYKRTVALKKTDLLAFLHFGAVDYRCKVYVNGVPVGAHQGGYTSFCLDVTEALRDGENEIAVCVWDDTRDRLVPSGKQSDRYASHGCYYTRTTGIWQTVWLEFVPRAHLSALRLEPNIADGSVTVRAQLCGRGAFSCQISFEGRPMGAYAVPDAAGALSFTVPLAEKHLWEVGRGALYDVSLRFGEDRVTSYFGLRQVRMADGKFYLNGRPVFQRLVLDQGFYPDGVYTAPTDDALKQDIALSQALGFNGARLHQKVFEERFLYHADKMGYLVWGEYPDWGLDHSDPAHLYAILPEWMEAVQRDVNHPCIIGWCPRNETWDFQGRRQYDPAIALLYDVTKALDPSRPCIDVSGNYHVKTDVFCVHDYDQDPAAFRARYEPLAGGTLNDRFDKRQTYGGQPVFVSEYGGIAWASDESGWGYGQGPKTLEEFYERFEGLTGALLDNPALFGLCYTQLTDVEQEQNGLYTYDRRPKFDPGRLRAVLTRPAASERE